jgi:hypothetical protein
MNFGLNQRAQRIINHSMPLYATFTFKPVRHDLDVKMAFAILRTLVTRV